VVLLAMIGWGCRCGDCVEVSERVVSGVAGVCCVFHRGGGPRGAVYLAARLIIVQHPVKGVHLVMN